MNTHPAQGCNERVFPARTPVPVLVQQQLAAVELLVTVHSEADWGPVLTLGTGGVLTELIGDVVHLSLPCQDTEVRAALDRLAAARLLRGYRNIPPADTDALRTTIGRLQRVFLTNTDLLTEIELNPLLVAPAGQGVSLIDVLVGKR